MNSKILSKLLLGLSLLGFVDAAYLTINHFLNRLPPCTVSGCETVLTSEYAVIWGVPVALIGALYYVALFFLLLSGRVPWFMTLVSIGFLISLNLVGLQIWVIRAICQYCMVSAGITTLLFILGLLHLRMWRQTGNSS